MSFGAVDWGSVADWVSGAGSVSASIVALYLSGSDRRARRDSERPILSCRLEEGGGVGWTGLFVGFENPSVKQWQCISAEILSPSAGRIIEQDDAMERSGLDPVFSEDLRDARAAKSIDLSVLIGPVGSAVPSYSSSSRGNYTYRRFLATKGDRKPLKIRFRFASLEPSPDRFFVDMVR